MKDSITLNYRPKDRMWVEEQVVLVECQCGQQSENLESTSMKVVRTLRKTKKMALVANKTEEKRKMTMDSIVKSSWHSNEYSAPMEESISLVGKSPGMPRTTPRGFTPQIARGGQMKLEDPPQYSSRKHPGV